MGIVCSGDDTATARVPAYRDVVQVLVPLNTAAEQGIYTNIHTPIETASVATVPLPSHEPMAADTLPPRLPMNVLKLVALQASDTRSDAARLALTCRAWFTTLYAHVLLPHVILHGASQVHAFAAALAHNTLGIADFAQKHTKSLSVFRRTCNEALFDGAAQTRTFTAAILVPLRIILRTCSAIQTLHLACEPRVLKQKADSPSGTRRTITELVCLQSVWAGDLNDTLWGGAAPFVALSHVQLHGPRFRFTPRTAIALAELPQLTHLALIMPHVVDERGHRNAEPALQLLISHATKLQLLLVVGHDEPHWMGASRHLRPGMQNAFRTVPSESKLVSVMMWLITAHHTVSTDDPALRHHASQYSDWMMERAKRGTHWHFSAAEGAALRTTSDVYYDMEAWTVPDVSVTVSMGAEPAQFQARRGDLDEFPAEDEPPHFPGFHENRVRPERNAPEVWGIDNLD